MSRLLFEDIIAMTEQEMNHPTQGRRRRHKSPSSISSAPPMPVQRLTHHLDTADGPSDEEGEKDAKRQRSEPTTPEQEKIVTVQTQELMGLGHSTRDSAALPKGTPG